MSLPDLWEKICPAFLSQIQSNFSWWFDGAEGRYGGGTVRCIEHYPYEGEECIFCKTAPGDVPVLVAIYRGQMDDECKKIPLSFMCHVGCVQKHVRDAEAPKRGRPAKTKVRQ
jgi:hypothetical protein